MRKSSLFIVTLMLLSGCGSSKSVLPNAGPTGGSHAISIPSPASTSSSPPANAPRVWKSKDGTIALRYPAYLTPMKEFPATYFTTGGWRVMFDGAGAGSGKGLVRFTADASLPGDVPKRVTEILQIGTSDDPTVLRGCLTDGLQGGNSVKQPDRLIGSVPFTVYKNGDAGMSHQLSSVDLRTVHDGHCIAIDRLTISFPASVGANTPPQRSIADVKNDFGAILSSLTFRFAP